MILPNNNQGRLTMMTEYSIDYIERLSKGKVTRGEVPSGARFFIERIPDVFRRYHSTRAMGDIIAVCYVDEDNRGVGYGFTPADAIKAAIKGCCLDSNK